MPDVTEAGRNEVPAGAGRRTVRICYFLQLVYKLLYLLYTKDAATVDHVLRHRSRRDFERIEQSMQYVKRNYTNPITLKETADELSLTPEYFCRLFKKYTGQTFLTYVNKSACSIFTVICCRRTRVLLI